MKPPIAIIDHTKDGIKFNIDGLDQDDFAYAKDIVDAAYALYVYLTDVFDISVVENVTLEKATEKLVTNYK